VITLIGALHSRRWWTVLIVLCVGLVIGAQRGNDFVSATNKYENYARAQVLLAGVIDDDPKYGSRGDQQFSLTNVQVNSLPMTGKVFVKTLSIADMKRGDYVEIKGKLTKGFGSYQATMSFGNLAVLRPVKDPIRDARDHFAAGVRNLVSEPAASLGIGFVVGQRSALPPTLDDQLRVVGLTHIVVASGYNLTILVRFMRRLLANHSKYLAAVCSVGLMAAFVAVSGLSPSMIRATLVTGLSLLAWYYGRRFHPLMLIIYVAAATAWWYPIYIWSDIGWYLSFLAFAGVLIVAPLLTKWLYGVPDKVPAIMQLVIETMAAQIMTLPLILFVFGQLPVLSLLSNLLVAPVIPLAMVTTTLAGFAGWLAPGVFSFVGIGAEYVVRYVVAVVELLASVSWAQLQVQISSILMASLYAVISLSTLAFWFKTKHNFRATSVVD
jgi:competence protein ComEC